MNFVSSFPYLGKTFFLFLFVCFASFEELKTERGIGKAKMGGGLELANIR